MSKLIKQKNVHFTNKKEKVQQEKKPFSQLVPYYLTTGLKIKDLTAELD
jgi:hypothetical protein